MKTATFKKLAAVVIGTAVIGVIGTANAAPIIYTNMTNFQTDASNGGIVLNMDNFDTWPTGGFPQAANGITVSATNTGTNGTYNGVLPAISGGSGNTVQFQTQAGGTSVTFTFATPVNAFGIDVFDLGTVGATTLTLTTPNGAQDVFTRFTGGGSNQLFAGVIDTATSFSTVTITNTQSGDFVAFDNLKSGSVPAVPEPGTLAIFGLGLAGLCVARRRRTV